MATDAATGLQPDILRSATPAPSIDIRINPPNAAASPQPAQSIPATWCFNGTVCIESYAGAVGERDGAKLEQQVLVTKDGYELLSMYPLEDALLDWKLCDPIHYPSVESVGSWELPPLDRPSRTLQGDKDTPSAGAAVPLAHAGTFMWWRT